MLGAEQWYKYQSWLLWHPFNLTKLFDSLVWLINCMGNGIPLSLFVQSQDCMITYVVCLNSCNLSPKSSLSVLFGENIFVNHSIDPSWKNRCKALKLGPVNKDAKNEVFFPWTFFLNSFHQLCT
jgi:hypothetical protein